LTRVCTTWMKAQGSAKPFPKWFMTLVSVYGLGFQLLIMALMLVFKLESLVIPFFIGYSVLIIVFICIRKLILKP
jgi:antibiotic biosynthesis monooxygenase (ABM) superfamily enzyme